VLSHSDELEVMLGDQDISEYITSEEEGRKAAE